MTIQLRKRFCDGLCLDEEVEELVHVLNAIPGIETMESCCGHETQGLHVWFKASDSKGLFFLARCMNHRYWKYGYLWKLEITVSDRDSELVYVLHSGPIMGPDAYDQAKDLIENMNMHLNLKAFMQGFGLEANHFAIEDKSVRK